MTTIALPAGLVPSEQEWGLASNTLESRSALSQALQTREFPGARWVTTLSFNGSTGSKYRELAAFLAQLRGRANRVLLPDFGYVGVRGNPGPNPKSVLVASYPGNSISVLGFPVSASNVMLPGDYFQIGTELKMVIAAASSGGAGEATLTFEPPLRAGYAFGTSIELANPRALMVSTDDEFKFRHVSAARDVHYITLTFEEAFS